MRKQPARKISSLTTILSLVFAAGATAGPMVSLSESPTGMSAGTPTLAPTPAPSKKKGKKAKKLKKHKVKVKKAKKAKKQKVSKLKARRSAGCKQGSLGPGTHAFTFQHGGLLRDYEVHVPASYDGDHALPLLLNLHPLFLGGALHPIWTIISRQNVKAEEAGFIVLQPDGTGQPASWNGGEACCDPAHENGVDDVDFIDALVEHTFAQLCIDERRVYASGMSNGGYLSHRIACEFPERLAAIAPVVGSLSGELVCEDGRGMPVLQLSGSEDNLASRQASVDTWIAVNECGSSTTVTQSGGVTCTTHDDCKDGVEVTHCVVADGGHCAFTDADPPIVPGCPLRDDIVAQDLIWDFLSRWRLP